MAQRGARLLSLGMHHSGCFENLSLTLRTDGGGTRGLSSLYILKKLMDPVAKGYGGRIRPCEYFDLIGGTGINGLCTLLFARFVRISQGSMQLRRSCTLTASSITRLMMQLSLPKTFTGSSTTSKLFGPRSCRMKLMPTSGKRLYRACIERQTLRNSLRSFAWVSLTLRGSRLSGRM